MKQITILFVALFIINACNNNTQSNKTNNAINNETNSASNVETTVNPDNETNAKINNENTSDNKEREAEETQEISEQFNKMITDFSIDKSEITLLLEAQKAFNEIKSSKDIAVFIDKYEKAMENAISSGIESMQPYPEAPDSFYYVSDVLPGIRISYGAEGSGIVASYNYYDLYQKAKQTPQKDDDLFFEAYSYGNEIFEDYNSKQKFLEKVKTSECSDFETCYTLIGSGNCYNALLKIENALKSETNFKKQLTDLKESIISDLPFYGKFGFSRKKTLEYLEKINTDITLNDKQKEIIQKIKKEVETKPDEDFNYKELNP